MRSYRDGSTPTSPGVLASKCRAFMSGSSPAPPPAAGGARGIMRGSPCSWRARRPISSPAPRFPWMAAFPSRADGAMALILAIDQGTTSTRSMLFDGEGRVVASRQSEIRQYYPHAGWVEHDPEEIWQSVLETARGVLSTARVSAREVAAIGITNQRETTLLWERATGRPVAPAIVWQDRRTASLCADLARAGYTDLVAARTGLLLDPYFSATKIAWLLDA